MSINITYRQAKRLLDFFGGHDTEIVVEQRDAGAFKEEDGSPSQGGLYAYQLLYPERGYAYLGHWADGPDGEPADKVDPCLAKREPGEPMFTLLGRDPFAMSLVQIWAAARQAYPGKATDPQRIAEARGIAVDMGRWFCTHRGGELTIPNVLDHISTEALYNPLLKRANQFLASLSSDHVVNSTESPARADAAPVAHNVVALNSAARMSDVMQVQGSSLRPADIDPVAQQGLEELKAIAKERGYTSEWPAIVARKRAQMAADPVRPADVSARAVDLGGGSPAPCPKPCGCKKG